MKKKEITLIAQQDIQDIYQFIRKGNPAAAMRYRNSVVSNFRAIDDIITTPGIIGGPYPEYVRKFFVTGFNGYTCHVAYIDDTIYLVAAFRPGLSENSKHNRTRRGIRELRDKL